VQCVAAVYVAAVAVASVAVALAIAMPIALAVVAGDVGSGAMLSLANLAAVCV